MGSYSVSEILLGGFLAAQALIVVGIAISAYVKRNDPVPGE